MGLGDALVFSLDSPERKIPLVVDLDGTLINTDMLQETCIKVVGDHPLSLLRISGLLLAGIAPMKRYLAERAVFDPETLPYNDVLLAWLRAQKDAGRSLVLCTASHRSVAEPIAAHLGLFDRVLASDGQTNLSGRDKADLLVAAYGREGYDYVGNSRSDLPVWQAARRAVVVNASAAVRVRAEAQGNVAEVFPRPRRSLLVWRRVLRLHQYLKNVLLFVPLIAAHDIANVASLKTLAVAFVAFNLCASSVYIANDLLDLESDRLSPRKCKRPFAAGTVPIWQGVVLAPLLLAAGFGLAGWISAPFLTCLSVYFAITCLYSWKIKRVVLVDCLVLTMLYTLRVIAGIVAVRLEYSFWILAFSIFLFLSLAFVKRYAELQDMVLHGKTRAHGRGYHTTDAPLIQIMGISAGYAAVVVLALYIDSQTAIRLYRMPECVWGAVPIVLLWISWIWLQAHRGHLHDDPLVFAFKSRFSILLGVIFATVLTLGTVGLP